jgi:hypothetical protein
MIFRDVLEGIENKIGFARENDRMKAGQLKILRAREPVPDQKPALFI